MSITQNQPLRAIIWAAVSSAPQANEDEKYSLPSQVEDAQALCEREGWTVVDVLKVPGHSRNYKSLENLADDARAKGIDAFDRLIEHLEHCDFDVLICRDANRFARKASLLHYIVESIIEDCSARIYSFNDGWVDATNADLFAMVKGYTTAKEMKWIKEAARRGKDKLIERGLPISSTVPLTHKRLRDPVTGKDVGLIVNEDLRRLWDDMARLVLCGIGWNNIPQALYRHYGHADTNGKPYRSNFAYELMLNPLLWGHNARGHTHHPERYGRWVFDESYPAPDGIKVVRNVVQPVYTGEQAEQLKAELHRRADLHGRARPYNTFRFSGLFLCGECGHAMVVRTKTGGLQTGLRCAVIYQSFLNDSGTRYEHRCSQNLLTPRRYLQSFMNDYLAELLRGETPMLAQQQAKPTESQLHQVEAEIATVDQQIMTLITEQSLASAAAQPLYRQRVETLAEQLNNLKHRALELKHAVLAEKKQTISRTRALEEIRGMTLAAFWELPDRQINQYLKRIMGRNRFVIYDRQVVDIREIS